MPGLKALIRVQGTQTRAWIVAALFSLMAATLVVGLWPQPAGAAGGFDRLERSLVALCALMGTVATYIFPIHIRYHTKVCLTSVPLYLAAVLLPAPLAVGVIGLAVLWGEALVRREHGNLPVDVALTTLRWLVVGLVTTLIAHWPSNGSALVDILRLSGASLAMGLLDSLASALHIAFITHEPLKVVLRALRREALLVEAMQYLLGLLGALAARQYLWSPVLLVVPLSIIYIVFKAAKELQDNTRQMLESMADAVDLRDPYTGGHSRRVGELCAGALRTLGLWGPEADLITAAARVHDIGKIGIPDELLQKADRLEPEETKIMQAHTEQGALLLGRYRNFARGAEIVRHHHERWDGRGYPAGLKGMDIPFGARVIAVADSFDAMTSTRPYRRAMTADEAAPVLRAGGGAQWDAQVVEALLRSIGDRLTQAAENAAPVGPESRQFSVALTRQAEP